MPRAGGDKRGSSADRAARKRWMLQTWGDGTSCECSLGCGTILVYATVEADRKIPGGSYRRENIQPACRPCNLAKSDHADLTPDQIAHRVQETVQRIGHLVPALAV
jgi:5-methylcytosine-specific restriction endonuclease McrA